MSFGTALDLTLILTLFVLACTMANLLARITRLERGVRALAGTGPLPPTHGASAPAPQPVPPELAKVIDGHDPARLIFASPDCPMCDDAIEMVSEWPEAERRSTFIFYRDEPGADFLAPPAVRMVPEAAGLFRSLQVGATPTFMHVEGGVVAGRSTGADAGPPPEPAMHTERSHQPEPERANGGSTA